MRLRDLLLLIFFLCSRVILVAGSVTNVQVRQEGKQLIITYDLDETSNVVLEFYYATSPNVKPSSRFTLDNDHGHVTGAIGYTRAGKGKVVYWDVLKDFDSFVVYQSHFVVRAYSPYTGTKTILLGEYGYSFNPQMSYGLMLGQVYYSVGWYANARSNFVFGKPESGLIAETGGMIGDYMPFYNGETRTNHWIVSGGLLWDMSLYAWPNSMAALYVGAGYGTRTMQWQCIDGRWIQYNPNSYRNYYLETGIIGSFGGFSLMMGVGTIAFKYMEFQFGIGWSFATKHKQ